MNLINHQNEDVREDREQNSTTKIVMIYQRIKITRTIRYAQSSYSSYALSTKTKWLQLQVRPRQQSDNEAQRRSPRNTPEAKESRIRSRSLGISDGLFNSETAYDYAQLTQQQLKMASHSLAEVNRKLPSVSWKPLD